MSLISREEADRIVASLEDRQEEDFERDAKETIPIVEMFLSVPPGQWKAKHSRDWESAFGSPGDASWATPVPFPPHGINDQQRRMLEMILVCARDDSLEYRFSGWVRGRVEAGDDIEDALQGASIKKNRKSLANAFREHTSKRN